MKSTAEKKLPPQKRVTDDVKIDLEAEHEKVVYISKGLRLAETKQKQLKEINELVREGNDKIHQHVEKGILLLGKTGSGKSTLANILGGRKLQAIFDEEEGRLVIDALNPLKDIIISHNKVAETKIPNECVVGDIVVWDCPGFHDNRGIAQEIANGFYIKRLFETTKSLKFVLVVPESSLDNDRGLGFTDTVNQLIRTFTDISVIKGCISLVVTGVSAGRKPIHITRSIERIIDQDKLLTPETTAILKYLLKSVHVFYKPSAEGVLEIGYDFLSAINDTTKYAVGISDYARISISDASMDYVPHILAAAQSNFSEIANIVFSAVSETHGCIVDQNNRLGQSYKIIQKLLPTKTITYFPLERLQEHNAEEYFVDLAALSKLREVVNVDVGHSVDSILRFLNNILEVFEEYIVADQRQPSLERSRQVLDAFKEYVVADQRHSTSLKMQMQEYVYTLSQQMEYIKFFSHLCHQEILGYFGSFNETIEPCKSANSMNLERAIKSMVIVQDQQDPEYYDTAIKYLKFYNDQEWSVKAQAKAHIHLGDLSTNSRHLDEAVDHYLKSMSLDRTVPMTYTKAGNLLFNMAQNKACMAQYKAAIDCYKAVNNCFKVETCFEQMMRLSPENPTLTMDAADYFASIGRYGKATKLYQYAFSFSQNEDIKASAWNKKNDILKNGNAMGVSLAEVSEAHGFYDFDSVNPRELDQALIGVHAHVHHGEIWE